MKFLFQGKNTTVDVSQDDGPVQNGRSEPEAGTSGNKTSSSKKDKSSEFIKLRVIGQVCVISYMAWSKIQFVYSMIYLLICNTSDLENEPTDSVILMATLLQNLLLKL